MTSSPVVSLTDELLAEIERDAVAKAKACAPLDALRLIKEICRLRAEVEAMRVDAERYHWLRAQGFATIKPEPDQLTLFTVASQHVEAENLDAAIDAAMQS